MFYNEYAMISLFSLVFGNRKLSAEEELENKSR